VPITAVCPECQNRFRLHDGMLGKSMRCNVCQEVFVVQPSAPLPSGPASGEKAPPSDNSPRTRTDPPHVASRSGNVSDFVPLLPVAPPRPVVPPPSVPKQSWSDKIKPPSSADFPWEEGPSSTGRSGPKEITWSPDLELTPPPSQTQAETEPLELEYMDETGADRDSSRLDRDSVRPPKKRHRIIILASMLAFVVVLLGAGAFFAIRYYGQASERLFDAASKSYEEGAYDQARAKFEQVVNEYPGYQRVPEARFLAELSKVRYLISSVKNREEPQPAIDAWTRFVAHVREDAAFGEFAAAGRKDSDVWLAGGKLLEDVSAKANDVFDQDRPDESEGWLRQAVEIEKDVDQFRPGTVDKPDRVLANMAALRAKIDSARVRQTQLAKLKADLGDGDEEKRDVAERQAKAFGLDRDPAFLAMLGNAERKVQEKAAYFREPQPIPPTAVPDDGLTSLLIAPRFDRGERRVLPGLNTVFYCLARGVLYALDEADGKVLWAARTGLDTDIMPVRVRGTDQYPDLVLVASNTGNQFGITARSGRDGRPLWHHVLGVPCLGTPAVVGSNAYVSLNDPNGTVLEIVLATGDIVGRIVIGRPLGPVMAARAGTGHLYVPADSRAVYVFDVDRRGPEPEFKKLDPTLLGVMTTNHPPGSLRGVPVFSNPDPNEPGPKFLVLGQAAGLDQMKLRTFRLPEETDAKPDASNAYEIAIPGWASFPPFCDGEKLSIVTDRGEFGLYGLALDQNRDDVLFGFQTPSPRPGDQRPSRGQVVLAEEGSFWIVVAGQLRRFRFGVNMAEGVRAIPHGDPVAVGEPLHAPQVNGRGDTFVVVTQDEMACRATAVDALSGQVRWRRELGLIAKGDPIRIDGAIVVLDQAGGFYRIDVKKLAERGGAAWLVEDPSDPWLIAQPARGFTAYSGLIPGPDGTAFALMVGEGDNEGKVLVRRYSEKEKKVDDSSVSAPGVPAGQPVVSGPFFLIPMSDGILYRIPLGGAKSLEQGPPWRGDRLPATAMCYLTPISDDELFATDGHRGIARLHWSTRDRFFETRGKLQLAERPGATPVVIPGATTGLVVADGRGNLTMWDGDRLAPPVLRSWRPSDKNSLPGGRIDEGLRLVTDPAGAKQIVYTVAGRVVVLPADADSPKWVGPPPIKMLEGASVFDGGRVILTDRAGVVRVLDAKTGRETGDEFHLVGSHAFGAAALPAGGNRILVPLADGTLVYGELKPRAKDANANGPKNGPPPREVPPDKK